MNSKFVLFLITLTFASSWLCGLSSIDSCVNVKNTEMTNKSLMNNSNIHINNMALGTSKINSGIITELVEIKNAEIFDHIAVSTSKINSGINTELAEIFDFSSNIGNSIINDSKISKISTDASTKNTKIENSENINKSINVTNKTVRKSDIDLDISFGA